METLLEVHNLRTYFYTHRGIVKAVDAIDLTVSRGEIVGLAGESGSGKTVTALSIMRLVPFPGRILSGKVLFKMEDLLTKDEKEMQKIRGKSISMIYQDPLTSLNPVYTIGDQIKEAILLHSKRGKREVKDKIIELLEMVGIPDPSVRANQYPHELSGGMRQRVVIAMAIANSPELLIADEPTTSLDVTTQAQILECIKNLTAKFRTSTVLISHNLGVIAEICERIFIMYAGKIVESGDAITIFKNPCHPYTLGLMQSIPRVDQRVSRFKEIPGEVPNMVDPPTGCRFHPRCPYVMEKCKKLVPPTVEVSSGHKVSCFKWGEEDVTPR